MRVARKVLPILMSTILVVSLCPGVGLVAQSVAPDTAYADGATQVMHRLYNPNSGLAPLHCQRCRPRPLCLHRLAVRGLRLVWCEVRIRLPGIYSADPKKGLHRPLWAYLGEIHPA